MSGRIEAVIFDWAGTTVDYGCFAPVEAFRQAFMEVGIEPTQEEMRGPMGLSKRQHVRRMFEMPRIAACFEQTQGRAWTDADAEAVYRRSEALLLALLPRYSAPLPFVPETAETLRARGVRIGSTTGYNDEMMRIVAPAAAAAGYEPDCWFSADSTGGLGRPYPYMIFRALEAMQVSSVRAAVKVGDTAADIREGRNAGLITVGLIEGSSLLGLSQEAYNALPEDKRQQAVDRVRRAYADCGADRVLLNMSGLPELLDELQYATRKRCI